MYIGLVSRPNCLFTEAQCNSSI